MRNSRRIVTFSAALLWATAFGVGPPAANETQVLVLVVSREFPAGDISLATLKTAFRGRIAHVGGKHIIPINHAVGSPLRVEFDRSVLGLEPAAVGRFWVDQKIRDEGSPPKNVPTAELAVRVVAAIPTAITYARPTLLNPRVKALTVDGKGPGQPGYALAPPSP